ncbi:MAG TPA: response regulator [Polyangiaceae bacterium]|nr:response regulator [Polyangiaceae bacterium]
MTTTLLAVDDSKTMRRVLEITFAGEAYKISLAENADDALGKLQAERPSVVLVDAGLEGTNGYELCQRIKSTQPGVLVMILSSKHQPYDRNRGSQVGVDDFMDKPFDTQQMLDKVSALAKKGASSPMAAPAPLPQPDASARLRAQTLAYGSGTAAPSPPSPPVAAAPAPAPRPPAPVMPAASPRPMSGSRQPTMIGTPLPAELAAITGRAAPVAVPGLGGPAAVASPPAASPPAASPPAAVTPALPTVTAAAHTHTGNGSEMAQKLGALGLTREQADAVLALSREVVEKVVWEVVPTLAEALIKEEIRRLTSG